jgi:hypothetical protein
MLTSEEKHVRALKRRARIQLERLPALYEFVQRKRGKPAMVETPLTSKTDLVISGSPGSGNTVLREWLTYANPQIDVSSHSHSWTTAARAIRLHKPLVILVRDPVQAVASGVVRFPVSSPLESALEEYAHLYERCRRWVSDCVVASFDTATRDPSLVIRTVNRRYGTQYKDHVGDAESDADAVRARIDAYSQRIFETDASMRGAAPSRARDEAKREVIERLQASELESLMVRCQAAARPFFDVAI